MRVEDGDLVALVLEEPRLGVDLEVEAVRALGGVPAADVALGTTVPEKDDPAALVRGLGLGVLD